MEFLIPYHIICYPYIGLVRCAINIIPFDFIDCIKPVYFSWDPSLAPKYQTRYSSVRTCKYYPIFGKHNDSLIMAFIEKGSDD